MQTPRRRPHGDVRNLLRADTPTHLRGKCQVAADFAPRRACICTSRCEYERLVAHWRNVLPLPIHEVCYEDLIANQEHVTRSLLAHCGLSWDERCLAFYNTERAVQTASTMQVRKPLSAKSVGRWQHYRRYLDPLLAGLQANGVKLEPIPGCTQLGEPAHSQAGTR